MNSEERREKIIKIITNTDDPIKGSELAKTLNVSRQVIVQDIAVLRVCGNKIIATTQGYMINNTNLIEDTIYCNNHNTTQDIFKELKIVVDKGAKIKNVLVEHPMYGQVCVELNINSVRDIEIFISKLDKKEFKPLSVLSEYHHAHTIEADNIQIIEEIKDELIKNGIMIVKKN